MKFVMECDFFDGAYCGHCEQLPVTEFIYMEMNAIWQRRCTGARRNNIKLSQPEWQVWMRI